MKTTQFRAAVFITATIFLTSCGGGGGGSADAPAVPNNFTATSIAVTSPDPRIGYPLKASVSITADAPADNVSVSLVAIDKNDDPNATVRQIPLGTQAISKIEAGAHAYEVDVNVPSSVETAGPYYIGAIVDPVDEFSETDEDDNSTSVETTLANDGTPNIVLTEMALDRTALVIDTRTYEEQVAATAASSTPNVHNADAGGTITVGADGLTPNQTINIEAFAVLRMRRTDVNKEHDVPLYLWNTDDGQQPHYINAYGVDPNIPNSSVPVEWLPLGEFQPQLVETAGTDVTLNDVPRNSTHMNFYFPGRLGSEMEKALRYPTPTCTTTNCTLSDPFPLPTVPPPDLTPQAIFELQNFLAGIPFSGIQGDESAGMAVLKFEICVEIRPADPSVADRTTDDNEVCSPIAITLPPVDGSTTLPPPITGYTPIYLGSSSKPTGPLAAGDGYGTKGGGSVFSFGPIDFGATSSGDNRGYIEEIRGGIPLHIFGKLFDFMSVTVRAQLVPEYKNKPEGEDPGYTIELRFLNTLLDSVDSGPISGPKETLTFSVEAPAKEEEAEQQLFVGPIPVVAGAVVEGNIGVEYQFTFTEEKLANTAGPVANLEAILHAGVGTKFFSVGVEGVLTLLEELLEFEAGTELQYDVDHLGFGTNPVDFLIAQGQTLTNVFTGPRGALNLYAKYSVPKLVTCNWGFIKGKCIKAVSIKVTKNIWRSPALFKFEDVLWHDDGVQLEVVIKPGEDPRYYGPSS